MAVLVDDMYKIMKRANGIGLAAPQVGQSFQLAIIEIPEERNRNQTVKSPKIPLTIMINPKIVRVGRQLETAIEGCLSIPGVEVDVTRPSWVEVRFQNLKKEIITVTAKDLFARAIQHEIDHLNGILITDHGPGRPIPKNDD
jgi:peptide deformylase